MEYLDLMQYEYRKFPIPMHSIGWLGSKFGLQGSEERDLTVRDVRRLRDASWRLGSVTLGVHECDFCPPGSRFEGNGEYRYYCRSGKVYAAPMMILHYVERHNYHPPVEFLKGMDEIGQLEWDWRAERLLEVLLDASEDIDFRCEAVIDLVNWKDPRVLNALMRSVEDEELVDIAGDEIGRSLGAFMSCGLVGNLSEGPLPEIVKFGIDQTFSQ
ncbi:HEAT repeat domain-containing protein [Streptomyces alkaliphilus]|uniref:DUF7919 family protein n=1 Tax=Streptomyces alkaliphilus TaxID=1472722 RepID=UPI00117D26E0|nr:HEAT repeat domain-containing protein [Streptomyces alkaliphilus]MQS06919.1 hypothetical protein [Streptomyces alkaliphilus]